MWFLFVLFDNEEWIIIGIFFRNLFCLIFSVRVKLFIFGIFKLVNINEILFEIGWFFVFVLLVIFLILFYVFKLVICIMVGIFIIFKVCFSME